MPRGWVSETTAGAPIQTAGRQIVPFAHTLGMRLTLPDGRMGAGWTWTRPVSVLVREADGQEYVLPVVNITRRVTWSLYGMCAALALAAGIFHFINLGKRRKTSHG